MSVRGQADTTAILKDQLRKDMVESLKGNTGLKNYKEAGYNFKYTYSSTKHKGMVLFETTIAKKDYGSWQVMIGPLRPQWSDCSKIKIKIIK